MPPTYIYAGGQRRTLVDPKAYAGSRRDVALIYHYVGGQRRLVFSREPVVASAAASVWDQTVVSWVLASYTPDEFRLFDAATGGTELYRGPLKTYTHTLRFPSTAYSYRVESWLGGNLMSQSTTSVTTPAHNFDSFTAGALNYATIRLAWGDSQQRSIDRYDLYRNGAGLIYQAGGYGYDDGGLAEQTGYGYTLYAVRAGVQIGGTVGASTSTPARPTSGGSVYGPAWGSGYYWTQSTARSLAGPNWTMPVNGYVTAFNLLITGYSGSTGHFNPHIDGQYFGLRNCNSTQAAGTMAWSDVGTGNLYKGSGAHSIGCNTGGDGNYRTQWTPQTGGGNNNVNFGQVNFWYYTARDAEDTHTDWFSGPDGSLIGKRVYAKGTSELLGTDGEVPD